MLNVPALNSSAAPYRKSLPLVLLLLYRQMFFREAQLLVSLAILWTSCLLFDILVTNVSLPNGVFLVYGLDITQMNSSSDLALLTDNSTIGFMISNAYIIYEKHGLGIEEISNTTEPIFNALELVFHWCVNTFITSVDDGVPSTNIIVRTKYTFPFQPASVLTPYTYRPVRPMQP